MAATPGTRMSTVRNGRGSRHQDYRGPGIHIQETPDLPLLNCTFLLVLEAISNEYYLEAATTIARLVRTRYNITKEQKKSLKEAIASVLTEIAFPLGLEKLIK